MNKIKLFLLATVITVAASNVQGQKAGYMNIDQMLSIMPEVGKIDTLLKKFQTDSLNTEFQGLVQDYNYKDSMLNKSDTSKMPATVKRQYRQDLESIAYQVQNWQQISQNVMQSKQQELLAPIYQKIYTAINQVAKENGYAYVYKEEALIVAPPADNMLPLVAKKLNVKLPTQDSGAAANRPTANKPATTKKSQ
ncbi:MAG TPA: OmpH family outer membrane protein [Flavisolibacter sp.]|jgi:outer membrane protein|nr:OmpH family outer membrane protein [Flavisolibacter sp.]